MAVDGNGKGMGRALRWRHLANYKQRRTLWYSKWCLAPLRHVWQGCGYPGGAGVLADLPPPRPNQSPDKNRKNFPLGENEILLPSARHLEGGRGARGQFKQ